ncbi:MAG: bacillithiol biosynthesis protein BshC, partial [Candidatus Eiseniibacteriota bacterium]
GDVMSALLLSTFADEGLVVLDPRLPEFRAAARPLYERYAEFHRDVRARVDQAGDDLESIGLARGFSHVQTEFALFAAEGEGRRHLRPSEAGAALARGDALLPGALLRPIAQDFVLPVAVLVAGPGEIGYLAQLARAYEALGVEASTVMPRWTATWLPRAAQDVCEESGVPPEALVSDPDRALAAFFAGGVPRDLAQALEALRQHVRGALEEIGKRAKDLDRSLPQQVAATGARVDFRLGRLGEGFARKARRSWKRAHPEGSHLSTYLKPGGRLQERTLAWLDVIARGGKASEEAARERALAHVEDALAGRSLHHDCVAIEDSRG